MFGLTPGVRISGAIMHHPARSHLVGGLLEDCLPFRPTVVTDPDPGGVRSPLRTAKLAWAASQDGATHHLVLQDDVVPIRNFARHMARAVAAQPAAGIAFYVHWRSPQNAYYARRAAAAGMAWAPLSGTEWTPTLGLVLPVADARALAAYLATLPDELRHDDDYIVLFCAERDISMFCTIPHLLDHGGHPSLAGFDHEGKRYGTVFDAAWDPPTSHWYPSRGHEETLRALTPHQRPNDFTIELADSLCLIRMLRPGTSEPLEHPFGWYWHDWCELIGVHPDQVIADFERARDAGVFHCVPDPRAVRSGPDVVEFWAAGYLLGFDLGTVAPSAQISDVGLAGSIRQHAAEAWISQGLSAADQASISPDVQRALVEACLAGTRAGLASHGPPLPPSTGNGARGCSLTRL
jgi:hypothetical protein